MALAQAPAATEGSPFSMRCSVTRDIPAASAAAVLLTRNALRRARSCVPNAFSWAVLWVIGSGDFGDMCFSFCSK